MILLSYVFFGLTVGATNDSKYTCCSHIIIEDLIAYSGTQINGIYEIQNDLHDDHYYYKQAS